MALGACDPEVYRRGKVFLIIHNHDGSAAVEAFRDALLNDPSVKASGSKIDWHFIAGHAVFRVIGNHEIAKRTAVLTFTVPAYSKWTWEVHDAR